MGAEGGGRRAPRAGDAASSGARAARKHSCVVAQLCRVIRTTSGLRRGPRSARLDGRGPRPGAARDVRRARADGVSRARAEAGDATPTLRGLDVVRVARGGGRRRARGGVLAARGHLELEEQRAEARRARGVIGVLLRAGGPAHVERASGSAAVTSSAVGGGGGGDDAAAEADDAPRVSNAITDDGEVERARAARGGSSDASSSPGEDDLMPRASGRAPSSEPRGATTEGRAPDAPTRATSRARASRAAPRTSSARIRERATRGSARDAIDARHQHVLNTPTIVVSHEENPENLVSSGKKINPRLSSPSPRRFPTNLRADSGAPFRRTSREI